MVETFSTDWNRCGASNDEDHLAELARAREVAIDNCQISAAVQAEHSRGQAATKWLIYRGSEGEIRFCIQSCIRRSTGGSTLVRRQ